jgi:opacity protein-like surface antigen
VKKYLLSLNFIFFLVIPAWSITGISFGIHAGRATGFKYDMLKGAVGDMAAENGWTKNTPDKSLTMVGGHVNVGIAHIIDVAGFADYDWNKTKLSSDVNLKLSDFSYGLTVIKKFGVPFADPYIGAGLAWHKFVYSLEAPSTGIYGTLPGDQTKLGYHIVGGVAGNFPVFPLSPYAEYRYNWINTKGEKTTFSCLSVGLSFKF